MWLFQQWKMDIGSQRWWRTLRSFLCRGLSLSSLPGWSLVTVLFLLASSIFLLALPYLYLYLYHPLCYLPMFEWFWLQLNPGWHRVLLWQYRVVLVWDLKMGPDSCPVCEFPAQSSIALHKTQNHVTPEINKKIRTKWCSEPILSAKWSARG